MPSATQTLNARVTGVVPKSVHTSDPLLAPFLGPTFDPTAYLNSNLPALAIPTAAQPIVPAASLGITEHAARTQTQLASLAALSQQLVATLTELTNEVLRSGSRLAYAVELLRGEARALRDTLRETLQGELAALIPGGLESALARLEAATADGVGGDENEEATTGEDEKAEAAATTDGKDNGEAHTKVEPPALAQLRTLHRVRARLQEVVTTFDAALAWPLPPSAQAGRGSGLVSVAPPADAREAMDAKTREERGQAAQAAMRERVQSVLAVKGADGLLKAEAIVAELRELCGVWKGTAEEKPRVKFVDGLAKAVAERRKEEESQGAVMRLGEAEREAGGAAKGGADGASTAVTAAAPSEQRRGGLFGGLRRLRDEIYLE